MNESQTELELPEKTIIKCKNWHNRHWFIIATLTERKNLSLKELSSYFLYDNLRRNEPKFCILLEQNKFCHPEVDMTTFSCLFCACPFFWPCIEEKIESVDKKCAFAEFLAEQKTDRGKKMISCYEKCTFIHDINWVKENLHLASEEIQKILLRK